MTKNLNYLKPLQINSTSDTPDVFLSISEISSFRGRSLPENAFDFYEPILEWAKRMVKINPPSFTLIFQLDYFNSSSGRYLYEFLHILDKSNYRNSYNIIWRYDPDDDLMHERGQAFQSLCSLPFQFEEVVKQ
ncbi:MAG TPA: DUF1987 domain-containing protein [Flavobacteriales bacterium]|jgi:hypothetical protein